MTLARGSRGKAILAAAAAAVAVAVLGALSTDLGSWYYQLKQPEWKPPDALFGPAWTVIYALTALAGYFGWRKARSSADREWLLGLFALNGFLNVSWSLLFFRLQRPDWALVEVGFLWLSIVLLIVFLLRYARGAAWLLAPYLLWVSFAATLNWAVVKLNGPFSGT